MAIRGAYGKQIKSDLGLLRGSRGLIVINVTFITYMRMIMAAAHMEKEQATTRTASSLGIAALQAASAIVLAFAQCDEELRTEALELFQALASSKLDEEQRIATTALLAEILFPHSDADGLPGLDLAEAEQLAARSNAESSGCATVQGVAMREKSA
jgi:hypothetical protein